MENKARLVIWKEAHRGTHKRKNGQYPGPPKGREHEPTGVLPVDIKKEGDRGSAQEIAQEKSTINMRYFNKKKTV
jgi:hypothetical protein